MAERAWFLSAEEENEALGINGARLHLFLEAKTMCFGTIRLEPFFYGRCVYFTKPMP
jgi:hypothetical protein